jgi:multidrug efflux pump subunit AcrA (membrane-fusion protein)
LPEGSLAGIQVGDMLQAQFTAMGFNREVKVARISPNVDAVTRTIEVIAELPNPDGALKAGMLAELAIDRDAEAAATPAEATEAEATEAAATGINPAGAAATVQEVAKP